MKVALDAVGGPAIKRFDPVQYFVRQKRKAHRMDAIEIAGGLQKRSLIQRGSPTPECKYDPVHPNFHRKIDRTFEIFPYAGQDRTVLPVIIAQVNDENAAGIQPRMAVAIEI